MQSTFKFPLALAVLHQVELGKLQLDQPVRFLKSDRSETFSPLQQEFPEADVDVSLRKIIMLTVETSDNTAADIQLRLIGGPAVLQQYLDSLGLSAIHQQDSEHTLHGDQKLQYRDYAEPAAMVVLLRLFADHSPLNPEHTAAVFVIDAHVNQDACEHVIAAVAKAVYDGALAQQSQKPQPVLADPLLDKMVGHWMMTGKLMGKQVTHTVDVEWILNHQFLQIHEVGAIDPSTGKPQYEAMPLIGYDNMSERYVAHWIDFGGGRYSETLGYGKRMDNEIDFVFEYPDGPFRTNFVWDSLHGEWHWRMTQKNASGQWKSFADLTLRSNENRRSEP
jgi:hypothetical protein